MILQQSEEDFWKQTVLAYLVQGGDIRRGAHLKFADRAVVALRNRQPTPPPAEPVLERYRPSHIGASEFTKRVKEAVESSRNKIPAIKALRESAGLGLKEAKEAVEAYAALHPNLNWGY